MKSRVSIIILAALLFTSHEVLAQKSSFLANMTNREVVADGNDGSRDLNAIVAAYTSRLDSKAFPGGEETPPSNPYFARRQVTSCNTCHVAVPKLNTYGRLVKNIGYELPELDLSGHEEFALKKMSRYIPFAFRGIVDFANGDPDNISGDVDVRALQLLGGGSLFNNKVSWWMHTHLVEDNDFSNPFENTPHELWGQYNLALGDATRVSVRGGMSELPLWFAPSKTKLSEIPYAVYDAAIGESEFTFSRPQFGVMVSGTGLDDLGNDLTYSWALAAVNGQGDFKSGRFTQIFGRFTKTFPAMSFGVFGFVGSQDLVADHVDGPETFTDRLYRFGLDLETYVGPVNFFATGVYGRDTNPIAEHDAAAGSYYGGFFGADVSVLERLIVSARYDGVRFQGGPPVHDAAAEVAHEEAVADPHADHAAEAMGGHLHGALVTSNSDALVFGANYLLTWQLRLTTEVRRGFGGLDNKWIAGLQFAF